MYLAEIATRVPVPMSVQIFNICLVQPALAMAVPAKLFAAFPGHKDGDLAGIYHLQAQTRNGLATWKCNPDKWLHHTGERWMFSKSKTDMENWKGNFVGMSVTRSVPPPQILEEGWLDDSGVSVVFHLSNSRWPNDVFVEVPEGHAEAKVAGLYKLHEDVHCGSPAWKSSHDGMDFWLYNSGDHWRISESLGAVDSKILGYGGTIPVEEGVQWGLRTGGKWERFGMKISHFNFDMWSLLLRVEVGCSQVEGIYMLQRNVCNGMPVWKSVQKSVLGETLLCRHANGHWRIGSCFQSVAKAGGAPPDVRAQWQYRENEDSQWLRKGHVTCVDNWPWCFVSKSCRQMLDVTQRYKHNPAGFEATPVPAESKSFDSLQQFLKVQQPDQLGKGRDVESGRDQNYTNLELVHAWKVHLPAASAAYCDSRRRVKHEASASILQDMPTLTTDLDRPAKDLGQLDPQHELDDAVNEKFLLHGTSLEMLPLILRNGLSEKFSNGLLGKAVYLADRAEKMDQYPRAQKRTEAEFLQYLTGPLYQREKTHIDHVDGLFYCLVVRATLGYYLSKKKFPPDLWATQDKSELRAIPHSLPAIPHHSLVAETGGALERFKEFAIYNRDQTCPEFVLAYRRVNNPSGQKLRTFQQDHLRHFGRRYAAVPDLSHLKADLPPASQEKIRGLQQRMQPLEHEGLLEHKGLYQLTRHSRGAPVCRAVQQHFDRVKFQADVVSVWEIGSNMLSSQYFINREKVRSELSSDAAELAKRSGRSPKVSPPPKGIDEVKNFLPEGLHASLNETLLFHGTTPERLCKILHGGFNERFSGGLYGHGTYLAEDIEKSHGYTALDSQPEDHLAFLHKQLFGENRSDHPMQGGHRYVFICRVCLGFPLHVGSTLDATSRAFVPGGSYELIPFAGHIPHHSLVADGGWLRGLFGKVPREFVVYRSQYIMPIMLVAYRRK